MAVALTGAVVAAGCARDLAQPPVPQSKVEAQSNPEPLPAGIKPLTVEQEEMISQ